MAAYLRTSDIARAVGVHANTVRLYEEWGYLPPIPRSRSGYRQFTPNHLEQMRLARILLQWPYPGGKQLVVDLVQSAAAGNLGEALELTYNYLAQIRAEQAHANAAVAFLERWAQGQTTDTTPQQLHIGEAARRLGVTADMLRNWERNGLMTVPRDAENHYRLYGAAEIGRVRVIRMLRQSGYSLMAILRMLLQVDAGRRENLGDLLDTPRPDEDVYTVADQWLTTLGAVEKRALAAVQQLTTMMGMKA